MDQIIRLDNDIQKAFLKKHFTAGVFIDFQKAFNMLWKNGLLIKMSAIGIRGNMLVGVNNFLRLSLRLSSCIFGTSACLLLLIISGYCSFTPKSVPLKTPVLTIPKTRSRPFGFSNFATIVHGRPSHLLRRR